MLKHILIPYSQYEALMAGMARPKAPDDTPASEDVAMTTPRVDTEGLNDEEPGYSIDQIVGFIPKRARNKALALLDILKTPTSRWNTKGELLIQGAAIKGSHITDLIRFTVLNHVKPPVGAVEYRKLLAQLHIPTSIIVNRNAIPGPSAGPEPPSNEWISLHT
jgi:hypothetical protein